MCSRDPNHIPHLPARRTQNTNPSPAPLAFGPVAPPKDVNRGGLYPNHSGSFGNSSPSDTQRPRYPDYDRSPASISSSLGTGDRSYGGLDSSNSRSRSRREQQTALTKAIDFGGSYAPNRLGGTGLPSKKPVTQTSPASSVKPLLLLGKSINAIILLTLGVFLGSLVVTKSTDWIYSISTGTSPLVSCPSRTQALGTVNVVDGSSCSLRFSFASYSSFESSVSTAFKLHNTRVSGSYQCFQSDVYTTCSPDTPCHVRCFSSTSCLTSLGSGSCGDSGLIWGDQFLDTQKTQQLCSQTIYLSNYNYPIQDAQISLEPLCGDNLNLTPGMIQTLRSELIAVAVMILLLVGASIVKTKTATKTTPSTANVSTQKALTIAKSSANELKALVESQWDSEYEKRLLSKPQNVSASSPLSSISPTGGLRVNQHLGPSSIDAGVHPAKQFASSSWKYRVRVMHAMMRKREKAIYRDYVKRVIFASLLLVLIAFATTVLLLSCLPKNAPYNIVLSPGSIPSVVYTSIFAPLYNGGIWVPGSWVDIFVVIDFVLEFFLVGIAIMCGHRWNSRPSDRDLWKLSNEVRASEDACMVVTVPAGTCLRSKSRDRLIKLIESGLRELKFGAVVVVDMGPYTAPIDDTWSVVSRIDPVCVHYVYLPDTHKKLAGYWVSQVWLPFLYRNGRVDRKFKNFVDVDFENLTTKLMDHPTLNQILTSTDDTAANCSSLVMVPTKCAGPVDWTNSWENMRLSSEYFMRICETSVSGGMVLSTNFAEPVSVHDHSRNDWQNMNPDRTGLSIVRQRGKTSVVVSTDTNPIGTRNSVYKMYWSMSQTVTTGVSQIWECVFAVSSYKHGQSVLLKIFLLIGPILSMVLIVLRPFLLCSLLFRDPLGLMLLLLVASVLSIATKSMERISILRGGIKKKSDNSLPYQDAIRTGSLVSYPFYQTYLGCMRIGLGIGGCTFGRSKEDIGQPSMCSQKELYPCPPHPDIDWFTVWRTSDASRLSVLSTAIDASIRSNSMSGANAVTSGAYSQDSWCENSVIV
jgi:hypothetical protein